MQPEVIVTKDGSHSLYIKALGEHYHSINGAIQESMHIFINAGLRYILEDKINNSPKINILEIGLGTGLNALLTFAEAQNLNISINYSALEAYPIHKELVDQLNYATLLNAIDKNNVDLNLIFQRIHSSEWEKQILFSDNFSFHKIKDKLQTANFDEQYNVIYFDAFAPSVQPEMWTEEVFIKLFSALDKKGILVTYCAKGEVKRILKKIGFNIDSLQGPPGKREMVRAIKK
ncbi:MAG: tRNA (5-methylaminomethyl-2-thiouridine)(34)-methyltransferase MnmD [Bacteroidia bacterium]